MALPFIQEDFQREEEYSFSPAEFLGYDVYFRASRLTEPEDLSSKIARNSVAEDKKVMSDDQKDGGGTGDSLKEVKSDSVGEEKWVATDEKEKFKKTVMEDSVNEMSRNFVDKEEKLVADEKGKIKKSTIEDSLKEMARNSVAEEEKVVGHKKVKITSMEDAQRVSMKKNQRVSSSKVRAQNQTDYIYREKNQKTDDSINGKARNFSGEEEKVLVDYEKVKIAMEDDQMVSKNKNQRVSSGKDFQPRRAQNTRKYNWKDKVQKTEDSVKETARNSGSEEETVVVDDEKVKITMEDDQRISKKKNQRLSSGKDFQPRRAQNTRKYNCKERVQKTEDFVKETARNSAGEEEKVVADDEKVKITAEDDQRVSKKKNQRVSSGKCFWL